MLFYSVEEIEKDIFAFEGVEVQVHLPPELKFIKLYSFWTERPLDGQKTVDDLKTQINKYIHACVIPKLTSEIPVNKSIVLCAGYRNQPLDIILATNDKNEYKSKLSEVLEPTSNYTVVCGLFEGVGVDYLERNIKD